MWMLAAMDIDLGTPIEEWEIYMLLIYCFECAWDLVHGESKTCPLCLLNHHKLKLTVKGRSPRRKTCIVSIGVWSLIHSQIVEIQWHFKVMEAIIWYMWFLWLLNRRLLEEKNYGWVEMKTWSNVRFSMHRLPFVFHKFIGKIYDYRWMSDGN